MRYLLVLLLLCGACTINRPIRHKNPEGKPFYGNIFKIEYSLPTEECEGKKSMVIYAKKEKEEDFIKFRVCGYQERIDLDDPVWIFCAPPTDFAAPWTFAIIGEYQYPIRK